MEQGLERVKAAQRILRQAETNAQDAEALLAAVREAHAVLRALTEPAVPRHTAVRELRLDQRVRKVLLENGITTVGQWLDLPRHERFRLSGYGPTYDRYMREAVGLA